MGDLVGSLSESVQMKTTHAKKPWVGLWGQSVVLQVVKHLKKGYLWRVLTNKEVVVILVIGSLVSTDDLQTCIYVRVNGLLIYYNRPDVQKALHANTTGIPYKWTACR
ncbi:hypothetical protein Fmac_025074 [Flemingia macrophylla]|uniref:Uncharacterized protein n=1 Tax=Flemingia macrophylla TaxID=520843 RepID=A0ABD1LRB7_9FABA